jgi:peptidoglycan hydrolase CwlO-like protein
MEINRLGGEFRIEVSESVILDLANKIDELVAQVNLQDALIDSLQRQVNNHDREITFVANRVQSQDILG